MIVYKVVRRKESGALVSVLAIGKAQKHYIPGTTHCAPGWLARRGYYLIAFGRLKYAKDFARVQRRLGSEIWRCEATGITPSSKLPPLCHLYYIETGELQISGMRWPTGTVMCKTIKLLKEVK